MLAVGPMPGTLPHALTLTGHLTGQPPGVGGKLCSGAPAGPSLSGAAAPPLSDVGPCGRDTSPHTDRDVTGRSRRYGVVANSSVPSWPTVHSRRRPEKGRRRRCARRAGQHHVGSGCCWLGPTAGPHLCAAPWVTGGETRTGRRPPMAATSHVRSRSCWTRHRRSSHLRGGCMRNKPDPATVMVAGSGAQRRCCPHRNNTRCCS